MVKDMVKEHTLGLMDTSYEGEWVNGREHVQGSLIFPYWSNYVGEFKDGSFNGQGTFTSLDGDKYVGEFKGGNFWNGTTYEIDGNIFGKWVNGKLKVKYPP